MMQAIPGPHFWPSSKVVPLLKRTLRFRLRTIFAFLTIVALVLWAAIAGLHLNEHLALLQLRRAGVKVELVGLTSSWNDSLWMDFFLDSDEPVRKYRVRNVPAKMLQELVLLPHIVYLSTGDPNLTDAALEDISRLESLRGLRIGSSQCFHISDSGVHSLSRLKNLRELCIDGPNITDAGIGRLPALDNLQHLQLINTQVTDASLATICRLRGLRGLAIISLHITDNALMNLSSLPDLYSLDLRGTQITDAGLQHLAKCDQLAVLYLDHTRVTDRGLRILANLKQLHYLSLRTTSVTPQAMVTLQGVFPSAKIVK